MFVVLVSATKYCCPVERRGLRGTLIAYDPNLYLHLIFSTDVE